jgi:hypothetical protein
MDSSDIFQVGQNANQIYLGTSGLGHVRVTGDLTVWGSDIHVGDTGVKITGSADGDITFLSLSDGYQEDLNINLDDTENTAVISSSTSLATINFSAIALTTTGAITGGAITGTSAEVNGTVTLAYDETIANSTDTQILFSANGGENLAIDLDTATDNQIEISSPGGATDLSISSLNLATTGTISGRVVVATDDNGKTLSAAELNGSMQMSTGAGTWVIPDVDAAAGTGQVFCIYATGAHEIVIDGDAEDKIRNGGTLGAAGGNLTNATAEAAGDFVCLMLTDFATDVAHWTVLGNKGTWTVP